VALGKQRIGPRIQAKSDVISQDLSSFGQIFSALREKFEASNCLQHHCTRQQALVLIGEFSKELKDLQAQARDLIELQELLETSVFNFSLLKTYVCHSRLGTYMYVHVHVGTFCNYMYMHISGSAFLLGLGLPEQR
jgi:hypothetical protein